jgi:hypothetical protein
MTRSESAACRMIAVAGPATTLRDVADAAGLPVLEVRRLWRLAWLAGEARRPSRAVPPRRRSNRPPCRPGPMPVSLGLILDRLIREHPDEWAREIAARFEAEAGRPVTHQAISRRRSWIRLGRVG